MLISCQDHEAYASIYLQTKTMSQTAIIDSLFIIIIYHYHKERSTIAMSLKSDFSMALLMSLKFDRPVRV